MAEFGRKVYILLILFKFMDITEIISKGESERVEFKESLAEIKEILQTIVAFANSKGGIILIGVKDNGEIKGVNIGKNTIENLANEIARNIEPKILPSINVVDTNKGKVISIKVDESERKPLFFKGVAYKRIGKSNQKMGATEIELLILKRHSRNLTFDMEKINAKVDEINVKFLRRVLRKMGKKFKGIKKSLADLGLLRDGKLTNAAILLFGKDPVKFFPFLYFKCMKVNSLGEIEAIKDISGNVIDMIEETYEFAKKNLPKKYVIEDLKGKFVFRIPLEAIREAIINAVLHRDYTFPSFCYLKIDDEKVEISNPGILPEPLKISDLYKEGHRSILRNPLIGRILKELGYIESWGTGTYKIVMLCTKEGVDVRFEEEKGFFKVVFRYEVSDKEELEVMKLIVKLGKVTTKDVSRYLNCSERTARRILYSLWKQRKIKRHGKRKGTYYFI